MSVTIRTSVRARVWDWPSSNACQTGAPNVKSSPLTSAGRGFVASAFRCPPLFDIHFISNIIFTLILCILLLTTFYENIL